MPTEQWRPVPQWEGFYEVSDLGRVRSLARTITRPADNRQMTFPGRLLKLTPGERGYLKVHLRRPGHSYAARVHRLVAMAFAPGEAPGLEVCHNNGVPDDNRAVNLRWDTSSANKRDSVIHGTHPWASRTHCPRGHGYSDDNTRISGRGRVCITCSNAESRARYHAKKVAS